MIVSTPSTPRLTALALAVLALALAPLAARAASTSSEADSLRKGRFVVRGSGGVDLDKTINIGGENTGETVAGALNLGVGYFVVDNLSLDTDLDLRFTLAPKLEVTALGVTPGLRYYPIPQFYVRAALPIVIVPDLDIGVLAGVGYRQKIVANTYFVLAIDYTYWVTDRRQRALAPGGRLDINAGVHAYF
jgi:hypothetical protein